MPGLEAVTVRVYTLAGMPSGLPQKKANLGNEPCGPCLNLDRPCKWLLMGGPGVGGHL